MTLNIISDIHFQPEEIFSKNGCFTGNCGPCSIDFDFSKLKSADYLLIAGDLATDNIFAKSLAKVKEETKGKFKNIYYVFGNHDYWDFSYLTEKTKKNKYVEEQLSDDIVLLGTTLWTPVPKVDEFSVVSRMNDFSRIPNWNIDAVRRRYVEESKWLREKVASYKSRGKKVIVMTHTNPRVEMHPDYEMHKKWWLKTSANNPDLIEYWGYYASYYVTDGSCNDIKPDIWISGHHHTKPIDMTIDGVRYIRNTIGYSGSWFGSTPELSTKNWYDFIIDV